LQELRELDLVAEERTRDVHLLTSDNHNVLSVEELLGEDRCELFFYFSFHFVQFSIFSEKRGSRFVHFHCIISRTNCS
jgi:hypothetical protein